MSIEEREERLFQKLREKDPDIVADGVICEQEFLNARYKIVYILKEVNGGKSWDLRDFVYEGGRPQTWDNIARRIGSVCGSIPVQEVCRGLKEMWI